MQFAPPAVDGSDIVRLDPSFASKVAARYEHRGGGYEVDEIVTLMREKGIFGILDGGELAAFIGRHDDGNMGMLQVLEDYRRRGYASRLEQYLIGYIKSLGRTPICDVYFDNAPSIALQRKLGLSESSAYTFWTTIE